MADTPWVNAQNNTPPEPPDDPGTKTHYPVSGDQDADAGLRTRSDEPPIDGPGKTHYPIKGEE